MTRSDNFYIASDYLNNLKNYYSYFGSENHIENFNPNMHTLTPSKGMNTSFLREVRTLKTLKDNFLNTVDDTILTLGNYQNKLDVELNRLEKIYGVNNSKGSIISNKIMMINNFIAHVTEITKHITRDLDQILNERRPYNYREMRHILENQIKLLKTDSVSTMQFSQNDEAILKEHKGDDLVTNAMKFFGVKSNTADNLENITRETNKCLFYMNAS